MMTKIVGTSLAAAVFIAGLAWISSAPASSTSRPYVARGVSITLPADGLATSRRTAARGFTTEAGAVAAVDIQARRPRASTSAN